MVVNLIVVWVLYFLMSLITLRLTFANSWRQLSVCASIGATAAVVIVGILHYFIF